MDLCDVDCDTGVVWCRCTSDQGICIRDTGRTPKVGRHLGWASDKTASWGRVLCAWLEQLPGSMRDAAHSIVCLLLSSVGDSQSLSWVIEA